MFFLVFFWATKTFRGKFLQMILLILDAIPWLQSYFQLVVALSQFIFQWLFLFLLTYFPQLHPTLVDTCTLCASHDEHAMEIVLRMNGYNVQPFNHGQTNIDFPLICILVRNADTTMALIPFAEDGIFANIGSMIRSKQLDARHVHVIILFKGIAPGTMVQDSCDTILQQIDMEKQVYQVTSKWGLYHAIRHIKHYSNKYVAL